MAKITSKKFTSALKETVLDTKIKNALALVEKELRAAIAAHEPYHSAHEGFGVIYEEFDELKEEVWKKASKRNKLKTRGEAVQLASTSVRFIVDLLS